MYQTDLPEWPTREELAKMPTWEIYRKRKSAWQRLWAAIIGVFGRG
jgi:hypothetical protein